MATTGSGTEAFTTGDGFFATGRGGATGLAGTAFLAALVRVDAMVVSTFFDVVFGDACFVAPVFFEGPATAFFAGLAAGLAGFAVFFATGFVGRAGLAAGFPLVRDEDIFFVGAGLVALPFFAGAALVFFAVGLAAGFPDLLAPFAVLFFLAMSL